MALTSFFFNMNGTPNQNRSVPSQKKGKQKKENGTNRTRNSGKKKFSILPILGLVLVVFIVLVLLKISSNKEMDNSVTQDTIQQDLPTNIDNTQVDMEQGNLTGNLYNDFINSIHNFDAYAIDALVGPENGDSYIAQEWAYVNRI